MQITLKLTGRTAQAVRRTLAVYAWLIEDGAILLPMSAWFVFIVWLLNSVPGGR